jgi:hypothetical protein
MRGELDQALALWRELMTTLEHVDDPQLLAWARERLAELEQRRR